MQFSRDVAFALPCHFAAAALLMVRGASLMKWWTWSLSRMILPVVCAARQGGRWCCAWYGEVCKQRREACKRTHRFIEQILVYWTHIE
jgi:hypothetical protein